MELSSKLCSNDSTTSWLIETRNIDCYSVSMDQDFRKSVVALFQLRVSHEVAVRVLARAIIT